MRIREDSPFYGITEEQKEQFMDEAEELTHERIAELWEMGSGKATTRDGNGFCSDCDMRG